jgi:hypothetical protein
MLYFFVCADDYFFYVQESSFIIYYIEFPNIKPKKQEVNISKP